MLASMLTPNPHACNINVVPFDRSYLKVPILELAPSFLEITCAMYAQTKNKTQAHVYWLGGGKQVLRDRSNVLR